MIVDFCACVCVVLSPISKVALGIFSSFNMGVTRERMMTITPCKEEPLLRDTKSLALTLLFSVLWETECELDGSNEQSSCGFHLA